MSKASIFGVLFLASSLLAFSPLSVATAHDLLPPNAIEYLNTHPSATPQEIQQFIATQASSTPLSTSTRTQITNIRRSEQHGFLQNVFFFIGLGIHHILSGPDHVLFVLSLLLVFVSWKEILRLTATFTVAHTVTLLLAGTGTLTLSSRIVEPLIAFSIAYVALTSVFLRRYPFFQRTTSKASSVFFFGLFHGLGFAGLLQEIHLPPNHFISSLISFNLGIECGQLIVIVLVVPCLLLLRRYKWYPVFLKTLAALIAGLGMLWGIQRIIG